MDYQESRVFVFPVIWSLHRACLSIWDFPLQGMYHPYQGSYYQDSCSDRAVHLATSHLAR